MSIKQDCPSCMMGKHEGHNRDWNIKPGLIGGSWCGCTGDCFKRFRSVSRRMKIMLGMEPDKGVSMSEREKDEYGREFYLYYEVPPRKTAFAHWRGLLTHPDAVVSNRDHKVVCIGGWVASGEWWLHCGHKSHRWNQIRSLYE